MPAICTYNANGNLTYDGRQDLEIRWNVLNLVSGAETHDDGSLTFSRLSDGTLVARQAVSGGSTIGKRYCGSFVFTTGTGITTPQVESVAWDEGRVFRDSSTGAYRDCWFAGDHLGNVRSVVDISQSLTAPVVLEQNDYLPFGTRVSNSQHAQMGTNRWRYAGKEAFPELNQLDFGARMYDPFTARWTAVDPMAGKYAGMSPFGYCAGNPVNFLDPEGKTIYIWYGESNKEYFRYTGMEDDSSIPDNAYVKAVIEAYRYNKHNWETAGLKGESPSTQLVERKDIIVSVFADTAMEDNSYRGNGGFQNIIWNPTEGMQTDQGIILSPATLFAHEADHSLDDAKDARAHSDRVRVMRTDGYTNDEEYRVINGSEQLSALANGEIKEGQRTRRNHSGKTVFTKGPTSTVIDHRKR